MHMELIPSPGSKDLQVSYGGDHPATRPSDYTTSRVVVIFTTMAEAQEGLKFAQRLAGSERPVWFICPVTQSVLGRVRLGRYVRFAVRCADTLPASVLAGVRFLVYPCQVMDDAIEESVCAWHSMKMTARLQAASSSELPILLNVMGDAGHGPGTRLSTMIDFLAERFSFLLAELGVPRPN